MTRERLQELGARCDTFADDEEPMALASEVKRLLLERERAVNALKDILEPPKGGGFRSIPMEEGLAVLAFVEEEA